MLASLQMGSPITTFDRLIADPRVEILEDVEIRGESYGKALTLKGKVFRGKFKIVDSYIKGTVDLEGSVFHQGCEWDGSRVSGSFLAKEIECYVDHSTFYDDVKVLSLVGLRVSRRINLRGAHIHGSIKAKGLRCGRGLFIGLVGTYEFDKDNPNPIFPRKTIAYSLSMTDAVIEDSIEMGGILLHGNLVMKRIEVNGSLFLRWRPQNAKDYQLCLFNQADMAVNMTYIGGRVDIHRAVIKGDLSFRGVTIVEGIIMDLCEVSGLVNLRAWCPVERGRPELEYSVPAESKSLIKELKNLFIPTHIRGDIEATGMKVGGNFVLSGGIFGGGINAQQATIGVNFVADHVVGHPTRIEKKTGPDNRLYSIRLNGSTVKGNVSLRGLQASSGVGLQETRIGGDLDCRPVIDDSTQDVVRSAFGRGKMTPVSLTSCNEQIDVPKKESHEAMNVSREVLLGDDEFSLLLDSAEIKGDVMLQAVKFDAPIMASGVRCFGSFRLHGYWKSVEPTPAMYPSKVGSGVNRFGQSYSLWLLYAHIYGETLISGTDLVCGIMASGMTSHGQVLLGGESQQASNQIGIGLEPMEKFSSLRLNNAKVYSALVMQNNLFRSGVTMNGLEVKGDMIVRESSIGFVDQIEVNSLPDVYWHEAKQRGLSSRNVTVSGDIRIEKTDILGRVDFQGSEIGGAFFLGDVHDSKGSVSFDCLHAPAIQVNGSLKLINCKAYYRELVEKSGSGNRYKLADEAIDLDATMVKGDVVVREGTYEGSISIQSGNIEGNIHLEPIQVKSYFLTSTAVKGFIEVQPNTGGSSWITVDTEVKPGMDRKESPNKERFVVNGIEATGVNVGRYVLVKNVTVNNGINLNRSRISGSVYIEGSETNKMSVGKGISFDDTLFNIGLRMAKVSGAVEIKCVHFTQAHAEGGEIILEHSEIGSEFKLKEINKCKVTCNLAEIPSIITGSVEEVKGKFMFLNMSTFLAIPAFYLIWLYASQDLSLIRLTVLVLLMYLCSGFAAAAIQGPLRISSEIGDNGGAKFWNYLLVLIVAVLLGTGIFSMLRPEFMGNFNTVIGAVLGEVPQLSFLFFFALPILLLACFLSRWFSKEEFDGYRKQSIKSPVTFICNDPKFGSLVSEKNESKKTILDSLFLKQSNLLLGRISSGCFFLLWACFTLVVNLWCDVVPHSILIGLVLASACVFIRTVTRNISTNVLALLQFEYDARLYHHAERLLLQKGETQDADDVSRIGQFFEAGTRKALDGFLPKLSFLSVRGGVSLAPIIVLFTTMFFFSLTIFWPPDLVGTNQEVTLDKVMEWPMIPTKSGLENWEFQTTNFGVKDRREDTTISPPKQNDPLLSEHDTNSQDKESILLKSLKEQPPRTWRMSVLFTVQTLIPLPFARSLDGWEASWKEAKLPIAPLGGKSERHIGISVRWIAIASGLSLTAALLWPFLIALLYRQLKRAPGSLS